MKLFSFPGHNHQLDNCFYYIYAENLEAAIKVLNTKFDIRIDSEDDFNVYSRPEELVIEGSWVE